MGEPSKFPVPEHRSRRPLPEHGPWPYRDYAPLGIAGNLARFFIDSPLTPLLMLATLALGLLGLFVTPRQEDPQISVPMIDILFEYPGASSAQVANLAIQPLERIMSEITGVKHVYSVAERERGMVTVRFEVGEALEVMDRLVILPLLPVEDAEAEMGRRIVGTFADRGLKPDRRDRLRFGLRAEFVEPPRAGLAVSR